MYILCLARSYWQRLGVGAGACDEDLGLNLTKRGLAVPVAADSERPASGMAAASGPELGRIPADRPGRHWQRPQGTPLAKLSLGPCAARGGAGRNPKLAVRRRRRPGGLPERPAACSLPGPFMIVAAASRPGVGRAQTARPCCSG
jgi:hypothetical protein